MEIKSFGFSGVPKIIFGSGSFSKIDSLIPSDIRKVLVVTGSFPNRMEEKWNAFTRSLKAQEVILETAVCAYEPTPELVDEVTFRLRDRGIGLVIAIGGGSVVDAGKAISAMLTKEDSVELYLEGRTNRKAHDGRKVPFIAVPTTAGTGSEATKNAVLSRIGELGYKKSLRHDNFVPDIALLDPELHLSCPPEVTAASGLDALTQLLEAYLSTKASPVTDALALSGMEYFCDAFLPAVREGVRNVAARSGMAYAAFISGLVLANAGLGVVHGFASSIGGYFASPHGVICGTLLGEAMDVNLRRLRDTGSEATLKKLAAAGQVLTGCEGIDTEEACDRLVERLKMWIEETAIPRLGKYGVKPEDADRIVSVTDNKNNPAVLTEPEMREILLRRI